MGGKVSHSVTQGSGVPSPWFENEEIHVCTSILTAKLCKRDLFIPVRKAWNSTVPSVVQLSRAPMRVAMAVLWLLTVLACWPLQAGGSSPDARQHTLTLEARDLVTDAPVPNVSFTLSLAGDNKLQAATNSFGIARFEFAFPEPSSRPHFFLKATAMVSFR